MAGSKSSREQSPVNYEERRPTMLCSVECPMKGLSRSLSQRKSDFDAVSFDFVFSLSSSVERILNRN